ncbi:hypothetical protein Pen01_19790 [Phytomonospora endophytica]|nr:hypothetical protein Pen01_19790 [Phytomonospora endophytica]
MEKHFVDHMEAFGNGYRDPQDVVGRLLPPAEVRAPHECVPGVCRTDPGTEEPGPAADSAT